MYDRFGEHLSNELNGIEAAGLYKHERLITTRQGAHVSVKEGEVLNLCANNYLGLAQHPEVNAAAARGLEEWGYGMASVRFICGTQTLHKQLENKLSDFLGTEDTILYPSCFDANGGLFETLLGADDAVISDELNHASIIDGVRLCKAQRLRYANNNMQELERCLEQSSDSRTQLIVTDGVFSMDGSIANLSAICDLAERYGALVMVDDSHSTGFVGKTGRGTHEHCGVMGRVDIITSTLGKALGGAMGGFTSGKKEIVDMLRQRSRPYLFSNSLAPSIVGAATKVIDLLSNTTDLRDKLEENTSYFRAKMTEAGFDIKEGVHAIVPVMLYDAKLSQIMSDKLLAEGIYVIGFFFPVVPKDKARIRVQISADHTQEQLDYALHAFHGVGTELNII